ncbi:hypothetical protein ILFOPFJJ_04889 [Ensifer psoraleae]|nr:hypothetical protein [Sinorhizobium psoraleae]
MGYDWTGEKTRRMKMLRACAYAVLCGAVAAFIVTAVVR